MTNLPSELIPNYALNYIQDLYREALEREHLLTLERQFPKREVKFEPAKSPIGEELKKASERDDALRKVLKLANELTDLYPYYGGIEHAEVVVRLDQKLWDNLLSAVCDALNRGGLKA